MRWLLLLLLLSAPLAAQDEKADALVDAAWLGKVPVLMRLLDEGVPANVQGRNGTPLEKAAGSRQPECVRLLLAHGANPNLPGEGGRMPLAEACWDGELGICKMLLQAGADVNLPRDRFCPLFTAVLSGNLDVVRLMLQQGAKPDGYDEPPLVNAAWNFGEAVPLLLKAGAKPTPAALQMACRGGNLLAVQTLVGAGIVPSTADFQAAADNDKKEVAAWLLPHGKDVLGVLPSLCAAGWVDLVAQLPPSAFTNMGAATREAASTRAGDEQATALLVTLEPHGLASQDEAVGAASELGYLKTVRWLLERGAARETAYLAAARGGRLAVLQFLGAHAGDRRQAAELATRAKEGAELQLRILEGHRNLEPGIGPLRERIQEYSQVLQCLGPSQVDILFVGAHPDDDSMAMATLAHYVHDRHCRVAVITATRGEGGGNFIGRELGAALGVLREAEERAALGLLGISQVFYLDRIDFGFTLSAPATARAWGEKETLARLERLVEELRPDVIVTLNPGRGHGNHQYIARLATQAFFHSSARKLYYALEYTNEGANTRITPGWEALDLERRALRLYRTQGWESQPPVQPSVECFQLASSRVPCPWKEDDLLTGLDAPGPGPTPASLTGVEVQVDPSEFARWAHSVGLDWLARRPGQVVVAQGGTTIFPVLLRNHSRQRQQAVVGGRRYSLAPGSEKRGTFQVSVPANAPLGSRPLPGWPGTTLAVVPSLAIPRLARSPRIGAFEPWQGAELRIPCGRLWEGKTRGPADLTGRCRIAHDEKFLYLHVTVDDDVVDSSLAADDNAGHWRTDSVEVGLQTGKQLYKWGLVPFNRDGQPMAARDADDHPGPVPGLALASRKTPSGYELETALPLPGASNFAFNVMLYDADPQPEARTAWSAWETVQGQPRLWGRAHLQDD